MDSLEWGDDVALEHAKNYFENFVTTWNPHAIHMQTLGFHHSIINDPCSLGSTSIFTENHLDDYEELVNCV